MAVLSRAFLLGALAVLVPAVGVGLAVSVGGDDAPPRLPVNTVRGAPSALAPPVLGVTTRPLAPTPPPGVSGAPGTGARDYAMTSASGNRLVHALVARVIGEVRARKLTTAAGVSTALGTGMARIAQRGYEEIYDTQVREAIGAALDRPLARAGIDPDAVVIG